MSPILILPIPFHSPKNSRKTSFRKGKSSSKVTWHYILAANTATMYTLYPSDLNDNNSADYYVFNYVGGAMETIADFNLDNPLTIPVLPHNGTDANYLYYVVAPSLSENGRGYSLLGEPNKFVTASGQRFTNVLIAEDPNSVKMTAGMMGGSNENVNIQVVNPTGIVETYNCALSAEGTGSIECIDESGKQPVCVCH